MLKFGQFGVGRIGQMHALNLTATPHAKLLAIYDIDLQASARLAAETGSQAVNSVDALLDDASIDAVLIASSTETHCELIERSVQAGKAVLCEKPIHLDITRVDACKGIVASAGQPVQIGFNRRFDPTHNALQQAVQDGEIGKLEQVIISSRDPAPPPIEYLQGSGGLFRDMMIHDFDMARFLMGEEPVEITAMGCVLVDPAVGEIGDIDTAMVVMRMVSGALCHINCSRRCAYGYDQRIEVFGEKGMLVSTNPTSSNLERYSESKTSARDKLHHFFLERYAESYHHEIDAFINSVESGNPVCPGFEDGRRALILANAAEESSRSGQSVLIPE